MPVVIHLKEHLSAEEIKTAEALARASGMTLDDWLVFVFKQAIRQPPLSPPSASYPEK